MPQTCRAAVTRWQALRNLRNSAGLALRWWHLVRTRSRSGSPSSAALRRAARASAPGPWAICDPTGVWFGGGRPHQRLLEEVGGGGQHQLPPTPWGGLGGGDSGWVQAKSPPTGGGGRIGRIEQILFLKELLVHQLLVYSEGKERKGEADL